MNAWKDEARVQHFACLALSNFAHDDSNKVAIGILGQFSNFDNFWRLDGLFEGCFPTFHYISTCGKSAGVFFCLKSLKTADVEVGPLAQHQWSPGHMNPGLEIMLSWNNWTFHLQDVLVATG